MDNKMIAFLAIAVAVGLAAGAGIGYVVFDEEPVEETYWYYLYFGADDDRNKWYSATGSDATVAFDKAMDAAGFEWDGSSGYPSSIAGVGTYWALYEYTYSNYSAEAETSSVAFPVDLGYYPKSNGWNQFNGYDVEDEDKVKLYQSGSNAFFLAPYDADKKDPINCIDWMNSGPFAA